MRKKGHNVNMFKKLRIEYKFKKLNKQPISDSRLSLIQNALQLFPHTIDFSDGELLSGNGFYSDTLSQAWHDAENSNLANDINTDFMIWAIWGVLHQKCRNLFTSGIFSINTTELNCHEINAEYIRACLEADLEF